MIEVQIVWFPGPGGRGAIRVRDLAIWEGALWCQSCCRLGYDHGDIDAVLEARRLGVERAPGVVDSSEGPTCKACS